MNYLFFDEKHYFISAFGETDDEQKLYRSLCDLMDIQLLTP
jgi:hypothetical protein